MFLKAMRCANLWWRCCEEQFCDLGIHDYIPVYASYLKTTSGHDRDRSDISTLLFSGDGRN
jgi:hypothetical protein